MDDDFNFDDDFLFDDIDRSSDIPDVQEGKVSKSKQIYKTSKTLLGSVGKGILSGLKSGLAESFPNTADLVNEVVSIRDDITSLKDDIVREIDPTLRTLNTIGTRLLPKAEDFIPKKLYEKAYNYMKEHSAEDEVSDDIRLRRERESIVSTAISEAFGAKMDQDSAMAMDQKTDAQVDRLIASSRFKTLAAGIQSIDSRLEFATSLMAGSMTNYFKKSLELKYQHLFVARDLFDITKKTSSSILARLEEIKHNAGLPDSVKAESLKKPKILESFGERVGHLRDAFFKNLKTMIMDKITSVTQFVPMLDMATSMMDMAGDKKITKTDIAAVVTKFLADRISHIAISRQFEDGKARDVRDLMETRMADAKDRLSMRILSKAADWEYEGGIKATIAEAIRGGMSSLTNTTIKGSDLFANPDKAAEFDNITKMSIISTIPRHLEHIGMHVERLSEKLASDVQLIERRYDPKTGQLLKTSEMFKNMMMAARSSTGFSEDARAETLEKFKATYAFTQELDIASKDVTDRFTMYKPYLDKFITNVAINLDAFWDPEEVRAYALGGTATDYIRSAFEGIEDSRPVAQFITDLVFDKNNMLNVAASDTIGIAIFREAKNLNPKKLADFISKHNLQDLAIKTKLYNTATNRISTGAIHEIFKTPKPKDTSYTKSVGGKVIGKEEAKPQEYNYHLEQLKDTQKLFDVVREGLNDRIAAGKTGGITNLAYELLLGDKDINDEISKGLDKASKYITDKTGFFKKEFTAAISSMDTDDVGLKKMFRKVSPKATVTKVRRISNTTTELTLSVPVPQDEEYVYRDETVTIKHMPTSTEEMPVEEITIAAKFNRKPSNPLFKRYHHSSPDRNKYPITFDPNTVELYTKKDTAAAYSSFSFDNIVGSAPTTTPKPQRKRGPRPVTLGEYINDEDEGFTKLHVSMGDTAVDDEVFDGTADNPFDYLIKAAKAKLGKDKGQGESIDRFLRPKNPSDEWFKQSITNMDSNVKRLAIHLIKSDKDKPKEVKKPSGNAVLDRLTTFHNDFLSYTSTHLLLMREMMTNGMLTGIRDPIGMFVRGAWRTLKSGVTTTKDWATTAWGSAFRTSSRFFQSGANLFDKAINVGAKVLPGMVDSTVKAGGAIVGNLAKVYGHAAPKMVDTGIALGKRVGQGARKIGSNIWEAVKDNPDILAGGLIGLMAGGMPGAAVGALTGATATAIFRRVKGMPRKLSSLFKKYVDVYDGTKPIVPGKPLLSANQQKEGVYFADNTRLKDSYSITEPVFSGKDGETAALITQDQIDAGLVDVHGNRLTKKAKEKKADKEKMTFGSWTGNTIIDSLGHIYKGLMGLVFGMAKTGTRATKTILGRLFGIEGAEIKDYHIKVLKHFENIYTILSESAVLARKKIKGDLDHDGDRDGSWQDQLENIYDEDGKPVPGTGKSKSDKAKSGGMTTLLASLAGKEGKDGNGSILGDLIAAKLGEGILKKLLATKAGAAIVKGLGAAGVGLKTVAGAAAAPVAIAAIGAAGAHYGYKGSSAFFDTIDSEAKIRQRRNIDKNEEIGLYDRLAASEAAFYDSAGKIKYFVPSFYLSKLRNKAVETAFGASELSKEEITMGRKKLEELAKSGDPSANERLNNFNRAVKNKNWRYARSLLGITKKGEFKGLTTDLQDTIYKSRDASDRSILEDDSLLGRRVTLIIETINKALRNTKTHQLVKRSKLRDLKSRIYNMDPAELTKKNLDILSQELADIDRKYSDTLDTDVVARGQEEKEKEELIKRRNRLIEALKTSEAKCSKGPIVMVAPFNKLKNDVYNLPLEELSSKKLDEFDKRLKALDKNAIASSPTYMKAEHEEDRKQRLDKLLTKINKALESKHDFGKTRLMRLRIQVTNTDPTAVDNDYVQGLENSFKTTANMIAAHILKGGDKPKLAAELKQAQAQATAAVPAAPAPAKVKAPTAATAPTAAASATAQAASTQTAWSRNEYLYALRTNKFKLDLSKYEILKEYLDDAFELLPGIDDLPTTERRTIRGLFEMWATKKYRGMYKTGAVRAWANDLDGADEEKLREIANVYGSAPPSQPAKLKEQALSFDKNNKLRQLASGIKDEVKIPAYKDGTIIHSHPQGTGLSDTDISSAMNTNLRNMVAIAPDGSIQIFSKKSKEVTTIKDRPQQLQSDTAIDTSGIEDTLGNIHVAEATQVQQLNTVIKVLEALIVAVKGAKAETDNNIQTASLAAYETAVAVSDINLKRSRKPPSNKTVVLPSEINLSKATA